MQASIFKYIRVLEYTYNMALAVILSIILTFFLSFPKNNECLAPPYYGLDRPALDHELPPLEYNVDDLEPFIDGETVRVHYYGHHATYTKKLNAALKEWRRHNKPASRISLINILRNVSKIPSKWREMIRNNGGGYVNHNFYWAVMSPNPGSEERIPVGIIAEKINQKWGSFVDFKNFFSETALNLFGSGYVWLCRNISTGDSKELVVVTTSNQDTPLSLNLQPLLVIDIWEHAYYLKYRNKRDEYIMNWWNLVDWNVVAKIDNWWNGLHFHDEL